MLSILEASLHAIAAIGSHPRTNFREAVSLIESRRIDLMSSAFPYLCGDNESKAASAARPESYDELFDELDEIIAKEEADKAKNPDSVE